MYIFSFPALATERQYKIEAAFLYNFFNYITWPGYASPEALSQPVICLYVRDPILPYLNYIGSRRLDGRTLSVRNVMNAQEAQGCHMLFIRHRLPFQLLNALPGDTLVVFKPDDPLDRGGMIELREDKEHMTIKIDQDVLEQKGFQVSARLLDLARKMR